MKKIVEASEGFVYLVRSFYCFFLSLQSVSELNFISMKKKFFILYLFILQLPVMGI